MHIPLATYRVQLNKDFGFRETKGIVPYLAELGISHFYASPIFKARKGSMHGYDIIDPRQINPELGGENGFEEITALLKSHGLYWLQDIVPNHMAFDSENAMLMDVLERGRDSQFYKFFDIDWNHINEGLRGKLLVPFLGKFYAEALENGEIHLQYNETGFVINYYSLSLPLRIESYIQILEYNLSSLEQNLGAQNPDFIKLIGTIQFLKTLISKKETAPEYEQVLHAKKMLWSLHTSNKKIQEFIEGNIIYVNGNKGDPHSFDALDKLISEQLFRLAFWKVAAEEINYRRFFTINELISLKVEEEDVFNYTHDLVFKLVSAGKLQGLRIDHIDGLYDPVGYLKRLREKIGDTFVVVEKILAENEHLPSDWPAEGTTGYDFMKYVNGVFCKNDNARVFSKLYYKFINQTFSYGELVCSKKRLIISKHLAGNIDNLAHMMKKISSNDRYGRDLTLYGLRRALVEVMANFPVYRTYINSENIRESDRECIQEAIEKAHKNIPDFFYELNFIKRFLLFGQHGSLADEDKKELLNFIMNFQQYTAPLMAKGFEDTILYVYNRLISFNEVGSSPDLFGFTVGQFHEFNVTKASSSPNSLNATSTHDAKRGEDIRARINVLSEISDEWERQIKNWSKINQRKKKKNKNNYMPDKNDEYFLYQTLIGACPFLEEEREEFTQRMKQYVIKAVREAKIHTAWIKPDSQYEEACVSFVEKILAPSEDNQFLKEFVPFQKKIAFYGIFNSLSQVLLKLTCVGVPDFYQGTDLWDLNLVDPDNRRPVDFQKRISFLREIKEKIQQDSLKLINELLLNKEDGKIKLFLIYRVLQARKKRFALFQEGSYIPLEVHGKFKDNVIIFMRKYEQQYAIVIAPRFYTALIKEGELPVGEQVWSDTYIILPKEAPFTWGDVITGQPVAGNDNKLFIGKTLIHFPVSLLLKITS